MNYLNSIATLKDEINSLGNLESNEKFVHFKIIEGELLALQELTSSKVNANFSEAIKRALSNMSQDRYSIQKL